MLKKLYISNFALIDALEFCPAKGYTVITGETGAGKSIMLGALGLVLGKRSEGTDLFDSQKKCVIEAHFDSKSRAVKQFLKSGNFDVLDEVIVRREITPGGKSRSFINDTPAKLTQLAELGQSLISIHSQHGHLDLKKSEFILSIVDAYAGSEELASEYRNEYLEYQEEKKTLNDLIEKQNQLQLDQDYFQFLFNELEEANLSSGELKQSEEDLARLQHSEDIQSALTNSVQALEDDGGAVISNLYQIENLLSSLKDISQNFSELYNRIVQSRIELEDIRSEMENLNSGVEYDPGRIEELTSRVNTINHLLHKHQLNTEEDLLSKKEEISDRVNSVDSLGEEIEAAKQQVELRENQVVALAKELSEKRNSGLSGLEKHITSEVKQLGIKHAAVEFKNEGLKEPGLNGLDDIHFLFSANMGKSVREVTQVASGGELSRIMLSIKSIVAKRGNLPSIVFDEIDTGVSGEVAHKMGGIMADMAGNMQVISITHLPQVAAKGHEHYTVSKSSAEDRSKTEITKVSGEERILELAKMLSGDQVSGIAKENARILLDN